MAANRYHARQIAELERVVAELCHGAQSASVSSGTGSKSYTAQDIQKVRGEIAYHQAAISRNNARLNGGVVRRVYIGRR